MALMLTSRAADYTSAMFERQGARKPSQSVVAGLLWLCTAAACGRMGYDGRYPVGGVGDADMAFRDAAGAQSDTAASANDVATRLDRDAVNGADPEANRLPESPTDTPSADAGSPAQTLDASIVDLSGGADTVTRVDAPTAVDARSVAVDVPPSGDTAPADAPWVDAPDTSPDTGPDPSALLCSAGLPAPVLAWPLKAPLVNNAVPSAGTQALPMSCTPPGCPTYVAGRLVFDQQWLESPRSPLDLSNGVTVSLWYSWTSGVASLFTKVLGTGFMNTFQLVVEPGGLVTFGGSSASTYVFTGSVPLQAGRLTHLAGTYRAGKLSLFVDGVIRSTAKLGSNAVADDGPFLIGADKDSGSVIDTTRGTIVDVRLYAAELANQDIALLASPACAPP